MRVRLIIWALFVTIISAPLATASNIVVNPGFEQGLAGWTLSTNNPAPWFLDTIPDTGTFDIASPCFGVGCLDPVNGAFFYQDLPTVIGQTYSLSFFAFFEGAPDEIKVTWGGVTALDVVNPAVPNDVYAQYSLLNTLVASSTTTRLEFFGRQDPNQNLGVDDIAVTAPEPSTLLLTGVALLIAAGLRRRYLNWSRIPAVARSKYSWK
jgi:hypothetical protein